MGRNVSFVKWNVEERAYSFEQRGFCFPRNHSGIQVGRAAGWARLWGRRFANCSYATMESRLSTNSHRCQGWFDSDAGISRSQDVTNTIDCGFSVKSEDFTDILRLMVIKCKDKSTWAFSSTQYSKLHVLGFLLENVDLFFVLYSYQQGLDSCHDAIFDYYLFYHAGHLYKRLFCAINALHEK